MTITIILAATTKFRVKLKERDRVLKLAIRELEGKKAKVKKLESPIIIIKEGVLVRLVRLVRLIWLVLVFKL